MGAPQASIRRLALTRQVIYVLVAAAVIVPFLVHFPLEGKPSRVTKALFDKVQALPDGSVVLFSFDYDPSAMAELYPMSLALLRHCFRKGHRPIVMTHWANGVGLCKELVERASSAVGKKAGDHYVLLGFKPGYSNLILNMGESLQGAFDKDYYGNPTQGMPALEGVHSLKDIPLVVDIAAGATVEMWIAYGRDRFGFELGAGCTAVIAPDLYPFLQSGQLVGLLGGLRGAADYEVLLERPGSGLAGMQAQSVTHVLIIGLIIAANVAFLWRRRKT